MEGSQQWTSHLNPVGLHYFGGVVEDAEEVLEQHRLATRSCFGTRTSTQKKRTLGTNRQHGARQKENLKDLHTDDLKPSAQTESAPTTKIFWSHTIEGRSVDFQNTPFSVTGTRKLDCQFGRHYYKEKEGKQQRTWLQGTRKIGCKAHVTVHTLTLYSDFQLSDEEISQLGVRKLKEKKKEQIAKIQLAIKQGASLNTTTRYYVVLPREEAHHAFHETQGAAGYGQRIHPKLVDKIYELVAEGITNTQEVKRSLKHYVKHILCPDPQPDITDRAYYPTTGDIQNHVYKAQRHCQLSKLDQENLQLRIEQWKMENPQTQFHFRPYKESSPPADKDNHLPEGDGADNGYTQTLLYVHQEPWQQQLLRRYGNTISLMDATYKTTKYELALFFVAVKTNVGYSVVAEFVVQSETADNISEALSILSSWNPEWQPQFFMTDYSEAEIGAIKSIFPTCQTYLCDFHREQAWERWVRDRKHGLSPEEGEVLLTFLRNCAHAPSPTDLDLPCDHHYQQHVRNLRMTDIWQKNSQVKEWMETKWLSSAQIWAHAFRDRRFHAAVNTNNGVESQNKLLKYNYLPRKKSMTLSAIVILIVESFLPETYQKYLFENYKQSSQYRSYKAFVPEYLHGRPRSTILHCLDRRSKSLKYTSDDVHVVSEEEGIFAVKGSSGKDHTVSFGSGDKMPSCTCRDWVQWHMPCKHFFAIFRLNSQWDWNRLPNRYKESAYLSSDGGALDAFFQNPSSQSEDQLSDHPMEKPNDDSIPPDEIPVHQTLTKRLKQEGERVRTSLKVLETLTYNYTSPEGLCELASEVERLITKVREKIPKAEGIILRPEARKAARNRAKLICKKYRSLPHYVRRGQKRGDWRYRNRVGRKASELKKAAGKLPTNRLEEKATQPTQDSTNPPTSDSSATCTVKFGMKANSLDGNRTSSQVRTGAKRKRCGTCTGCRSADCRQCPYCLDMTRYGGPGRKKQCCINRRCLEPQSTPHTSTKGKQPLDEPNPSPHVLGSSIHSTPLDQLTQLQRKPKPILGDGNCLFRSLAHIIYGNEMFHHKMRLLLVDFVCLNKAIFKDIVEGDIEEHIARMRHLRHYGSAVELKAAATMLQMPVYTLSSAGCNYYRWLCYHPHPESTPLTFPSEPYPRLAQELDHIELLHTGGTHYDCVVSDEGHFPLDRPPLSTKVDFVRRIL